MGVRKYSSIMKKVFVAEDDQAIQEIITIILEGENYKVIVSDHGDKVIDEIVQEKPSLILLDIWLSGHDGGKIAKRLKSQEATKDIPIIIISANNATEKIAQAVGADGFLLKPFNIDDLVAIVKKHAA